MTNFFEILDRAMEKKYLVSVFSNISSPENFSIGIVSGLTKRHLLLEQISTNGLYDGYSVRSIDSIFRVDINGIYENKIKRLYDLKKQKHFKIIGKLINDKSDLYVEILSAAKNHKLVVALVTEESSESIIGWVSVVSHKLIEINRINSDGISDGSSFIKLEKIEKVYCDTEDEHSLGILNLDK